MWLHDISSDALLTYAISTGAISIVGNFNRGEFQPIAL